MLYSATACLGKKPSCVLIAMIALASTWITLYAGEHYLVIFSADIKISDIYIYIFYPPRWQNHNYNSLGTILVLWLG